MDDYNFYVFPYVSEWLDRNIENARQGIRFIDSQYKELFRIKDGNVITLTFDDGDNVSRVCRYIDEYHTEVGSELYHICQFAEIMERTGTKYEPAAPLPKDEKKPKPKNKEHER